MQRLLPILSLLLCAGAAHAVPLAVGANALTGVTVAADPGLAGLVVQDVLQPFTFTEASGTYTGVIQNRVVLDVDGYYDFYWRIRNTSFAPSGQGTPFTLGSFRIGDFGPTLVGADAGYRTDGLGSVGPGEAYVFSSPAGGYVDFEFGNQTPGSGLQAGTESYFFFIATHATQYTETAVYDLADPGSYNDNGVEYATFAPSSAVPEPAIWSLLGLGAALAGAALRRRSSPAHASLPG